MYVFGSVMETDPKSFHKILEAEKFVLWEQCRASKDVDVLRCYKYNSYNHVSSCTAKLCCAKCEDEHHYENCVSEVNWLN